MDFHKLTRQQLLEFVNGEYPVTIDHNLPLEEQAEELFEQLKDLPNIKFPLPVVDLYLASMYQLIRRDLMGEPNTTYSESQIMSLDESQVEQFAKVFQFDPNDVVSEHEDLVSSELGRSKTNRVRSETGEFNLREAKLEANRERIFRILSYLGLIHQTMVPELFNTGVLQELCSILTLKELNNFRKANYLDRINCQFPLTYVNKGNRERVKFFNYLDNQNYEWLKSIEDFGSHDALVMAIETHNFDMFKFIIDEGFKRVNSFVIDSIPVISYAIKRGTPEMVKYLVDKGANVNAIEHRWNTVPLTEAIKKRDFELIGFLVDHGARVNPLSDRSNRLEFSSPISDAVNARNVELVKYLVDLGADIFSRGPLLIYNAAMNADLPMMKFLVEQGTQLTDSEKAYIRLNTVDTMSEEASDYFDSIASVPDKKGSK